MAAPRAPAPRPDRGPGAPSGRSRRSRRRALCRRSSRIAPNASRPKNMTKLSSSATRDMTIAWPSMAMKNPASVPSIVDFNRYVRDQRDEQHGEDADHGRPDRQPAGFSGPNAAMPRPISHLPSGGWATNDGFVEEAVDPAGGERRVVVGRPRALVAEVVQRPGVLDVVGLVEDEGGRVAQVPEAQQRGQQGDGERARPGPDAPPARGAQHATPPGVEPVSAGGRRAWVGVAWAHRGRRLGRRRAASPRTRGPARRQRRR